MNRDGLGRDLTRPEAFLAKPTRTIILRTKATQGIILSNPKDQNPTTLLHNFYHDFCMHCSTIHESPLKNEKNLDQSLTQTKF